MSKPEDERYGIFFQSYSLLMEHDTFGINADLELPIYLKIHLLLPDEQLVSLK